MTRGEGRKGKKNLQGGGRRELQASQPNHIPGMVIEEVLWK